LAGFPLFDRFNSVSLTFFLFTDSEKLSPHVQEALEGIKEADAEINRFLNTDGFRTQLLFDHLSLTSMMNVKDCAACTICPPGNEKKPNTYGCIYDDDVNREFHRFNNASSIICDCQDRNGLVSPMYWIVLNRMRSVRRNNYMLTGKLGSTIETGLSSNNYIALKWLIRNNMGMLSSSSQDYRKFGRTLYMETLLRTLGRSVLGSLGVDLWTPPNHHE
jgi:multimeric flavodoxin WrbA